MNLKKDYILFGRYQILETLGQGSDGTVYLVRHLSLKTERAMKVLPKKSAPSLFELSEAQVLKELRHPGIPTIYDLEQDDSNYYLVEEYIRGESLEQFLLHQQSISRNLFLKFCEQLCGIFQYLHTLSPSPILYLDLKPEHIIVCGLQIKLIDFSISFITGSGNDFKHFGNLAFSAPELLTGRPPAPSSDIYSIGKIMEFMSGYADFSLSQNILTIIQKATAAEPDLRYETADDLISALRQANDNTGGTHLRQTIAVIGSHSGCGATHIAISLVCALNALGQPAVYYEKNSTDTLRTSVCHMPHMREREGCYFSGCFRGYPLYGEGIEITEPYMGVAVCDYGCEWPSSLAAADQILYVCGGAWHQHDFSGLSRLPGNIQGRLRIIANLCDRTSAIRYARTGNAPVYLYPCDTNPFVPSIEKKRFVGWLTERKGALGPFLHIRNLLFRLLRRSGYPA